VKVDHHDPRHHPYELIATDLRSRISRGEFAPGALLPSVKALAGNYEVAGATIQNAMRVLKDENLVVSAPNRGFYVRDPSQPDRTAGNAGQGQLASTAEELRGLEERVSALEAENKELRRRTLDLENRFSDHSL
jgi:DNA-binding GntR family transcriptional regulator